MLAKINNIFGVVYLFISFIHLLFSHIYNYIIMKIMGLFIYGFSTSASYLTFCLGSKCSILPFQTKSDLVSVPLQCTHTHKVCDLRLLILHMLCVFLVSSTV